MFATSPWMIFTALLLLAAAAGHARADEPAGHALNWYGWTELTASPYLTDARALADGDLDTVAKPIGGPQIGGWIAWRFPQPVDLTAVRFMQSSSHAANAFELFVDATGNGEWERLDAFESEEPVTDRWITIPAARTVHGLRLLAVSGSVGYRIGFPQYKQVEIYTDEFVATPSSGAAANVPMLSMHSQGRAADLSRKEIPFTPCIDLWMMGIHGGPDMPETREQVEALEGFHNMLRTVRAMDGQGVRMFLETPAVQNYVPWTSELADHHGRDTLRGVMEALHARGLTGSLFMHAWMHPFQNKDKMLPMPDRRWDYPYEQSSLVAAKGLYEGYEPERYPCILTGGHFRDNWLGILREAVERDVDGVYVMPDEYYFKGHDLDTFTCLTCQTAFQERYGYETLPKLGSGRSGHASTPGVAYEPRRVADTQHYRKWKLFEYEKLAELFNDMAGELAAINPDLMRVSSANPASTYYTNRRLEHGLAFDIIGQGENFNAVQLYASVPVGLGPMGAHTALARRMRASHPHAEMISSIQSLNFRSLPVQGNEIRFLGYVLPHVMNGASRIELYRLNYVDGDWLPVIRRGIDLVRVLENWGILASESDARTAVLLSRASEDWWQIRAQALMGFGENDAADLATVGGAPLLHFEEQIGTVTTLAPSEAERVLDLERFRGVYAGRAVESMLIENGIQYDVRYSDREDILDDLGRYDLVVLPFSYSMSQAAFEKVEAALNVGTRVMIFDQIAPSDAIGNPHDHPLLATILDHPNVTFIDVNLATQGMDPALRAQLRDRMLGLLDGAGGSIDPQRARVEFLSRRTAEGLILYLANWERSSTARPVLSLNLPAGDYELDAVRQGQGQPVVHRADLGGRTVLGADDLARFSVELEPGEVMLVRIARRN